MNYDTLVSAGLLHRTGPLLLAVERPKKRLVEHTTIPLFLGHKVPPAAAGDGCA